MPALPPRILVTGATDGIGYATAQALAKQGAEVLVHGRRAARTREVAEEVGGRPFVADLSSLAEVRRLGDEVAVAGPLDVLLLNAGVYCTEQRRSADGYELTLAVNHLANQLLTERLLPVLSDGARVVVVSSIAHTRGALHWDDLMLTHRYDGYTAYAQSKLANVLFSNALARRIAARGLTSNALHPGVITTKLLQEGFAMSGAAVDEGARTSVHLALSPLVAGITGRYFSNEREVAPSRAARDEEAQERLWEQTRALVGGALR